MSRSFTPHESRGRRRRARGLYAGVLLVLFSLSLSSPFHAFEGEAMENRENSRARRVTTNSPPNTAFTVELRSNCPIVTNAGRIPVEAVFNGVVDDFTAKMVTAMGADVGNIQRVSPIRWSFDLFPSEPGEICAWIEAGAVYDAFGRPNTISTRFTRRYDTEPPLPRIEAAPHPSSVDGLITLSLVFDEPVAGLAPEDLTIEGGSLESITPLDETTYTLRIRYVDVEAPSIMLAPGCVSDLAGNLLRERVTLPFTLPIPPSPPAPGKARIAIILDDGGYGGQVTEDILAFPSGLTLSIIPNERFSTMTAVRGAALGFEIMLHIPMESRSRALNPPGCILVSMNESEMQTRLDHALATVPGASGVNNHTGDLFTVNQPAMERFLRGMLGKGLFFVDSLTIGGSKGYGTAISLGIPAASNELFLDHVMTGVNIRARFAQMVRLAKERGQVIAIGHFRPLTVSILKELLPGLVADPEVELVHASRLIQAPQPPAPEAILTADTGGEAPG